MIAVQEVVMAEFKIPRTRHALSKEYAGKARRIGNLDADNTPATAAKYGIMSIPTLLLFKNGEVAEQIIGAQPREAINGMLQRHLA